VIRVLLAKAGTLTRGAMAALLSQQGDVTVVAESERGDEVLGTALRCRPDVVILDADLPGDDWRTVCAEISRVLMACRVLVLVDARKSAPLGRGLANWAPRVGFLANEAHPDRLVEAIRRMAGGEQFVDSEVAVAALSAQDNPLTLRELEVLRLAARGAPVAEIADNLFLAHGTVRNHLSRVIAKTGARTRIEAIRVAQDAGWL
jgi:two-component system response regulator DesR